jgi:hypothetical protein
MVLEAGSKMESISGTFLRQRDIHKGSQQVSEKLENADM